MQQHFQIARCDARLRQDISELPDDVLIQLVSSLPMKEAGKSSVLSKRWKHVWEYMTTLNFDASNIIGQFLSSRKRRKQKPGDEDRYCAMVEHVLRSHKASIIDEFRVNYDLIERRKENIDNWIRFAIEKRVKRLKLHIEPFTSLHIFNIYNFPSLSFCNMLTSIELASVNVDGEYLEKLLYECQFLEVMSIENSNSLVNLKVAAPSLSLKSLKLKSCIKMKYLEIFVPNLTSCYYVGPELESSPFRSTPKLAELYIGGTYCNLVFSRPSNLSSCISQIEVLTLDLSDIEIECCVEVFPVCTRLKVLHVKVDLIYEDELFVAFPVKGLSFVEQICTRA